MPAGNRISPVLPEGDARENYQRLKICPGDISLKTEPNCTYLLECADGTLYCGWTNNPEKRLAAHNAGTASKYTASRRPVKIVYLERFATRQEAMKREAVIKKMTRRQKMQLAGLPAAGTGSSPCPGKTDHGEV